MNVVPAKIAGVSEIVMITPPQETYHPAILVAAKLAGVDKIYQVGGAHGILCSCIWNGVYSQGR